MLLLYHTSDKSTTHSGRKLYLSDNLYLLNLIFQHPLDFITHGFGAGIAEMDAHFVGGLSDFPDQHRNFFRHFASCCILGHILVTHRDIYSFPGHPAARGKGFVRTSGLWFQFRDTSSFAASLVSLAFSSRKFFPAERIGVHRSRIRS